MHLLHINSKQDSKKIDKYIKNGSDVFILVYMVGCGPCNATRPEWAKLDGALRAQYKNNNKYFVKYLYCFDVILQHCCQKKTSKYV